jgi:hypothetical protein
LTAAVLQTGWLAITAVVGQARNVPSRVVAPWAGQFATTTVAIQVRTASTMPVYPAAVVKDRLLAPMAPVMEAYT